MICGELLVYGCSILGGESIFREIRAITDYVNRRMDQVMTSGNKITPSVIAFIRRDPTTERPQPA